MTLKYLFLVLKFSNSVSVCLGKNINFEAKQNFFITYFVVGES